MERNAWIGIGILVIVALGMFTFSSVTGNVIIGSVVSEMDVGEDYVAGEVISYVCDGNSEVACKLNDRGDFDG